MPGCSLSSGSGVGGGEIPEDRLEIIPDTEMCAACLRQLPDS
jgi:RNA polymerase-binding transcription factor DksA